jgi:hypothetical protein
MRVFMAASGAVRGLVKYLRERAHGFWYKCAFGTAEKKIFGEETWQEWEL